MADEEGTIVTLPNGWKYHVPTNNPDDAVKFAKDKAAADLSQQAKDEYANASWWQKPAMAGQDVLRTMLDNITLGAADKGIDWARGTNPDDPMSEVNKTKAIRSRMSGADVAGDIGTSLTTLPTAVPKLVKTMGGGAVARGLTGLVGATAEGAGTGAISAATHNEDPTAGAGYGAVAGPLGQVAAHAITSPLNKIANWGVKELPAAVPGKVSAATTPAARVEAAVGNAELKGGSPSQYSKQMEKVKMAGGLNPEQGAAVDRVMEGDPATKVLGYIGNKFTNPLWQSTVGMSMPWYIQAGTLGGGFGAKAAAAQGTREAADDLRRLMQNQPRPVGPLTDTERLGVGLRERIRKYYEGD